ncbi:MAG: hypothetical protein QOD99_575 [Chthoniobacter sp.]|nr:hypothetical protein [Chthoniobacter sp.]
MQQIPRFLGRGSLARYMGISEARIGQINPQPDALVDGRSVWLPETAARMKLERETWLAERQAAGSKRTRPVVGASA